MRESEIQQWDYDDRPCNYKEWPTVATPIVTSKPAPCRCEMCQRLFESRGVSSIHSEASCPHRKSEQVWLDAARAVKNHSDRSGFCHEVTNSVEDARRFWYRQFSSVERGMREILEDAVDQALADGDLPGSFAEMTQLRNMVPRKPGPALSLSTWQSITDAFKKTAKPSLHRPGDDLTLTYNGNPVNDTMPYVAYHEIGNRPEKPKPSRNYMDFVGFDRHLMDEIVKAFGMTEAELGVTERDLADTKHTNDVIALYKNGLISTDEAVRYLEPPKPMQCKPEKHYVYAAGHGFIEATAIPPGFSGNTVNEVRKNAIEAACNALRESNGGKEPIVTLRSDGWRVTTPDRYIEHFDAKREPCTPDSGVLTRADLDKLIDGIKRLADCEPREATSNPWEGLRGIIGSAQQARIAALDASLQSAKLCECDHCLSFLNHSEPKEKPMSISTNPVTDLADRARELAKNGSVRLDCIKDAIDQGKAERRERIEKALSGAIELDLLKGPQGKQFVLKHFYNNEVHTVYGTAYPGHDASEKAEDDLDADTVSCQGDTSPIVDDAYRTMRRLRKCLDDYGVFYVLKFYE